MYQAPNFRFDRPNLVMHNSLMPPYYIEMLELITFITSPQGEYME